MRLSISRRGRVRPSAGPSVPYHFQLTNMAVFERKKSSNDIINNETMSDDEVIASDVPPQYFFSFLSISPRTNFPYCLQMWRQSSNTIFAWYPALCIVFFSINSYFLEENAEKSMLIPFVNRNRITAEIKQV